MITLNLLPTKEKELIKREETYKIIIISLVIFLIGATIVGGELFWAKKILSDNLSTTNVKVGDQTFIDNIRKLNLELKTISEIQNEHIEINSLLVSLANITNDNILIKSFILNRAQNKFQISGWAKQRENLLQFQKNLESSKIFNVTEAPLSNLLKQEDIEFEFSGKINL